MQRESVEIERSWKPDATVLSSSNNALDVCLQCLAELGRTRDSDADEAEALDELSAELVVELFAAEKSAYVALRSFRILSE